MRCRKTYLCGFPYDGSIRQSFPCRPSRDFLISLSVDLKYTENTCFPTGRLMPKSTAERPQPAPSGKYRRLVPGSYRNCQILGIPLVLAWFSSFSGPQDTGERPRKPANFSKADVSSAIYGDKTPAFVGFLRYSKTSTPKSTPNRVLEGQPRAARGHLTTNGWQPGGLVRRGGCLLASGSR